MPIMIKITYKFRPIACSNRSLCSLNQSKIESEFSKFQLVLKIHMPASQKPPCHAMLYSQTQNSISLTVCSLFTKPIMQQIRAQHPVPPSRYYSARSVRQKHSDRSISGCILLHSLGRRLRRRNPVSGGRSCSNRPAGSWGDGPMYLGEVEISFHIPCGNEGKTG